MKEAKGIWTIFFCMGISLLLFSCSGEKPLNLVVSVLDSERSEGIPDATIELYRFYEGGTPVFVDSLQCDANGKISPLEIKAEKGYAYKLVASKPYYEAKLGGKGASLANQAIIRPDGQRADTILLYLTSLRSSVSSVDRSKQGNYNVNELIGELKGGNWAGNYIPRMAWGDIPALLELGGDTSVIQNFPIKTGSNLHPDSARLGQVMLWMVEAIRKDISRKATDRPIFLMPPSRVPVLGTRRGNPRLFNSKGALDKAHKAYQKWWEQGTVEDTLKKARRNPLRGTGLGWM